jgi:hypothetical protein
LGPVASILNVAAQAGFSNNSTQAALDSIQDALNTNTGSIDVIAYSGGSAAFTAAYGSLSASQQQRIGNILYVSPGSASRLAANGNTSVVRGQGLADTAVMIGTEVPIGVPISEAHCAHTDFGCLAQAAQKQINEMKANGRCGAPQVISRKPMPLPPPPPLSDIAPGFGMVGFEWDPFDLLNLVLRPTSRSTPVEM